MVFRDDEGVKKRFEETEEELEFCCLFTFGSRRERRVGGKEEALLKGLGLRWIDCWWRRGRQGVQNDADVV